MTEHHWKVRTERGPRFYKASRFARRWTIQTRLKGEEIWTGLTEPFAATVLEPLRDLLWAKYQRRRLPFEVVREIDLLLPIEQRRTVGQ
ncbi:MAG: hypothetical protein ACR2OZ_11710 [Verrucomicrobiales bacterium]